MTVEVPVSLSRGHLLISKNLPYLSCCVPDGHKCGRFSAFPAISYFNISISVLAKELKSNAPPLLSVAFSFDVVKRIPQEYFGL